MKEYRRRQGGKLKLDQDPKWPQLVWADEDSQIQHACVLFHGVCPPQKVCASLSRTSPALIRNISLRVTVLFQCL